VDTREKLSELTGIEASEIAQQSKNDPSSTNIQDSKTSPFNFVTWLYKWFQSNSFAPGFLSGIWSKPILGYLVAFVGQLLIIMGLLALFHTYPSFRFLEGPMILFILLVALGWGAGPSVVALIVGAIMLVFFVFPPAFSFGVNGSSEVIELLSYLAVGLTISILASNTERARRSSEQLRLRLDTIIDAIPDSIVLYDLQGKRIQQNLVAREMSEIEYPPFSVEEIPNKLLLRNEAGEPYPLEKLPIVRALKGEIVIGTELLYRAPIKQEDRLVSISAAPLYSLTSKAIDGAVTITHDLSERKRMEDALRASEERYRTIVQTANEGIWLIDVEARTLYANKRMAELLDVKVEDMLNHTVLEFVYPEDESEGYARIQSNLLGNYEQFDFRFRRKDGRPLYTLASTSPIRNQRGTIVGALGMFTDMTERKRAGEREYILAQVNKVLNSSLDYQNTIGSISQLVVPQLADWFAIDLVNAIGQFDLVEVYHKEPPKIQWATVLREKFPIDPDASTGVPNVVRTGNSELYAEITDEMLIASARNEEELNIARQIGFSSLMVVPLIASGRTIGAISFVSTESGRKYDQQDLALAEEVGLRAGAALENARLYRDVKQARDQLNIILQGVADGIIVHHKNGQIIYANEAATQLTGYALIQAMMETSPLGFLAKYEMIDEQENSFPLSQLTHRRVFTGEGEAQATIGYRNTSTHKIERWTSVKSRSVSDEQGEPNYAITIIHDITEQKIADEAQQRLAAIVHSSSDAIIGKTLEGIITSWNASAERMYGYAAEEIISEPITLLFPPDRQDEFSAIMDKINRGEHLDHYETTRVRKDGTSLNVSVAISPIKDKSGKIIGASAIARDVSEQKRLQAELWKSKQQLEVILENIADGITVQDTDGNIVYMNEAGARLCGYVSRAQLFQVPDSRIKAGSVIQRFVILDERGNPFPLDELPGIRALRGEKNPQAIIQYFDKALEQLRWSIVKAQPILDQNGEVQLAVAVFSDITESYEQQQRKDEFISMASHELKTPVTSLKGFTNVLQRRLTQQGDERTLHYLSRMDVQLDKLTKIINDLLDISKMQSGQLFFHEKPFALDSLIQETVMDVQAALPSHTLLIQGITGAQILGDRDRLEQVFVNLLTNAVKYSPKSDKVLLSLSHTTDEAIVCVQDFGIGIDISHHQKIFERFYQVTDPEEKTYPGLGMGLYIAHEIVNRHHGRMWVESKKGEGASFYIAMPILHEDNPSAGLLRGEQSP
jgi:PAS domain S-box-containing protein